MTKSEKIEKIIAELMIPHNVDVIVTGQYIDDVRNPFISIRPLLIVKNNKTLVTKNIQIKREELIYEDTNTKRKILCPGSVIRISLAVKELAIRKFRKFGIHRFKTFKSFIYGCFNPVPNGRYRIICII